MTKYRSISILICISLLVSKLSLSQEIIPLDTNNFNIKAKGYSFEHYEGKDAILLKAGLIELKDANFLDGTVEYDIYLKEEMDFTGINFRVDGRNYEEWYMRPHQSGNPDANQAVPVFNGIAAWQLYYGPRYSFPYTYKTNGWTHVKLVVNNTKAQIFLDYSTTPNLSWNLMHAPKAGDLKIHTISRSGLYIANISVNKETTALLDFKPIERKHIEGLIPSWEISNKFEEQALNNLHPLDSLIASIKWRGKIEVEEGTAANISRKEVLRNKKPGNTVFAKVVINSDKDQTKLFEFGYSDRVVVILNGTRLYKGNNNFKSRDYRYLGTIGLFDAVYLNLKEGENTLLLAVSESFGGWLVTGRINDLSGISLE